MKYITSFLCSLFLVAATGCAQQPPAHGAPGPMPPPPRAAAYSPSAEQMILDGLIYRPLALAGTVLGTGIFVLTLPFSMMGGNVDQARETLVEEPARDTFTRCLGCIDPLGFDDSY